MVQGNVQLRFCSGIAARPLTILPDLQTGFIVRIAGWSKEDEVFDMIVEVIGLSPQSRTGMTKREVDAVIAFACKIAIADFKRRITTMRAQIVKFFQSGR